MGFELGCKQSHVYIWMWAVTGPFNPGVVQVRTNSMVEEVMTKKQIMVEEAEIILTKKKKRLR